MIIGLVGPVAQDIQTIIELLTEDKSIQVVDSIDVIRSMDRNHINSLTTKDYHKKYFLKQLEFDLGTFIVTGNLLLSPDICNWLLQNDGVIAVVSRAKMELYDEETLENTGVFWREPHVQRYELEHKFKRVFEGLKQDNNSENLFMIDISDEDSEDLTRIVECSENWMNSYEFNLNTSDLTTLVTRKEDANMTMEESIRKAMAELGIDNEEEPTQEVEKPIKKKQQSTNKSNKQQSVVVETVLEEKSSHKEDVHEPDTDEEVDSIFIKLTDTTMALLLPVGTHLEKQSIGGTDFNVATVEIPDWNSRKLQELSIKSDKAKNETQPESISNQESKTFENKNPKRAEKRTPVQSEQKSITQSAGLKELQEEKARLDAEIKKWRSEGNIDMVNTLRKQRRVVRGKINNLK